MERSALERRAPRSFQGRLGGGRRRLHLVRRDCPQSLFKRPHPFLEPAVLAARDEGGLFHDPGHFSADLARKSLAFRLSLRQELAEELLSLLSSQLAALDEVVNSGL